MRFGVALDNRLEFKTSIGVLEETPNEDVLITTELLSCDVDGLSVSEDVINLVLFTEGKVIKLEINVVVLFGGTNMLELFLSLVVESEKLVITDEALVVAALVINVEFSDGVMTKDDVINVVLFRKDTSDELSIDSVAFLDNTTVELFTARVSVKSVKDGEKTVGLLMLTMLEDWISVLLKAGLNVVELTLMVDGPTTVLFGPTLDAAEVDNWTVALSLNADVKVTVFEMITVVVINVEFSDGVMTKDDVINVVLFREDTSDELSIDSVAFLDSTTVELFTASVSVKSVKDGEKTVDLLMLTMLEDWISVLLKAGLNVVELTLMVDGPTTVLFGPTLDAAEVDNWTVALSLNADVKVTVFEMITVVDIFGILDGGVLDVMGVAVTPSTCLLTLCLAMLFWAPDTTCHPTTGIPSRVLMVPS